jgi:PKD repeat protein
MIKRHMTRLTFILLLIIPTTSFGQKEVAKWFFGETGLDFNCNPPNPLSTNVNFFPIEGSSSISDTSGDLLFYTDGYTVFDRNHQVMPNGYDIGLDTFCYGSSTQGALIVRQPLQDSIYYIFTTDCAENYLADGFNYSIVNMNLNNGNGAVVLKKQLLLSKVCEKLAATRHANGSDVWILTHEWGNDKFYAYLLTNAGLVMTPVISSCGRVQLPADTTIFYPECAARGYMKFSPQGNRIAVMSTSDCHEFVSYPEIFSFNNSTGTVAYNYCINTQDSTNYYAGSFSPDGNLLYLSSGWYGNFLHQFDLTSNDSIVITNSKYIVYEDTILFNDIVGALQIAPDGKIYSTSRPYGLNAINNPNNYGISCNFQHNAIIIYNGSNCPIAYPEFGLPNNDESIYLNSFTGVSCTPITVVDFSYQDSCANTPVQFLDSSNFYPLAINNWLWDFGDPSSGPLNYSQLKNPQHTYSSIGTYQVKLIAYSDTFYFCKMDSVIKSININCVAGINQTTLLENEVYIFPNPFFTEAVLHSDIFLHNATFTLVNVFGQTVVQIKNISGQTVILQRNDLPAGLYFVWLTEDDKQIVTKKIIIAD